VLKIIPCFARNAFVIILAASLTLMKYYTDREETALDSLMEGFQAIGFDWRYQYVNKAVVTQSKLASKEDLIGFTMMEKFPGIENTEMFATLKRSMSERVCLTMENEFEFPDHSKGWFELRIEPIPSGIFILSFDITERKKAERQKEDHLHALEEMIFMTSHNLRQPITHILGVANVLDESVQSQEELRTIVGYMKGSALALDSYTRELTDYIQRMQRKAAG
jgi:nitrogen-specific signal transduction histidine kinase